MSDQTLVDVLRRQAKTAGDQVAVAKVSGAGEAQDLTYTGLYDGAKRLAGWLQHEVGLQTGDRVAILLDNNSVHEFFLSMAACWVGGFVSVPMNARLAAPELAYQLGHSGARALVAAGPFEPKLSEASKGDGVEIRRVVGVDDVGVEWAWKRSGLSEALDSGHELTLPGPTPETLSDLIYTSGTTGLPKGALFDHRACVIHGQMLREGLKIAPESRILLAVPLFTSTGIHTIPMPFLAGGGTMLFETEFDPKQWVARAKKLRPNIYFGVPAMLALILQTADEAELREVRGLESIMFGGSSMPLSVAESLVDLFPGVGLWNLYGLTEGGPGGTALTPEFALQHLSTVGKAMAGMEVRVVDGERNPVEPGVEGEVAVRTPSRMREYFDRPDETAQTIDSEDWIYTGDIGRLDEEQFLTILDRKNDMIMRGGFNVYPAEVEAALVSHADVAEAAVVGKPHAVLGEDVQAWVVVRDGAAITSEEITAYAREALADYKVPRDVRLVSTLPRNAMGKVLRRDLRSAETVEPTA